MKTVVEQNKVEHRLPGPRKVLRFHLSERMLHWSLAIPFIVCVTTAVVLVVFYNLHPHRPHRAIFAWAHRISGACLILFPVLTAIAHRRDYRLHLRNIREAWTWRLDDFKWLLLIGLAAISGNDDLPEQGKFNAAEKLNFMMQTVGYPVLVVTGMILWTTKIAFLSWLIHIGVAALATPLVLGHMYMAVINRGTRVGLSGMFSGYVDREWAEHHYPLWYREQYENKRRKPPQPAPEVNAVPEAARAQRAGAFD